MEPWKIKLLYDGDCPLCLKEVNFLRQKDGGRNLVAFVDIADLDYDCKANGNISFETAMGRIHALLPDGRVIKDLEVFRQVYQVLGMGWIYVPTRWPMLGAIANWLYKIWAYLRLPLTGRADLQTIIQQRQRDLEVNCRCQK